MTMQKKRLSEKVIAMIDANIAAKRDSIVLNSDTALQAIEEQIDELVFDLYELTDKERQLVRDTVN